VAQGREAVNAPCAYHLRLERAMARVEAKLDAIAGELRELKREERELRERNGSRAVQLARLDVKVAVLAGGVAVAGSALVNLLLRWR